MVGEDNRLLRWDPIVRDTVGHRDASIKEGGTVAKRNQLSSFIASSSILMSRQRSSWGKKVAGTWINRIKSAICRARSLLARLFNHPVHRPRKKRSLLRRVAWRCVTFLASCNALSRRLFLYFLLSYLLVSTWGLINWRRALRNDPISRFVLEIARRVLF